MKQPFFMYKTWVALAWVAAAGTAANAQPPLGLQEAVDRALAQSHVLRADSLSAQIAAARLQQQRQGRLPQAGVQASFFRLSDNITPFRVAFPTGEVVLNPQILNQSFNQAYVRQLLWAGGAQRLAEQQASLQTAVQQLLISTRQQDLAYSTKASWYRLYVATQSRAILLANTEALQAQRRVLQQAVNNGVLLPVDVLKIDLELAGLRQMLSDADNAMALQRYELALLTGAADHTNLQLPAEAPSPPAISAALEVLLPQALRQRADLQSMTLANQQAALASKQAKAAYLPVVSVGAAYNYDRPNQRLFPNEARFTGTWQAGIQLQWRLTDLYQNKPRVQEARLAERRQQAQWQQAQQGVQLELYAAITELKRADEALQLSQQQVLIAEENERLERQRLQAGTRSSADYVLASAQLLQARIGRVVAKANLDLAYHLLQKVTHTTR
jgi:outer membrane protein TolC